MSKFKAAIVQIAGTDYSKVIMYKSEFNLFLQAEDFVCSVMGKPEDEVQVNVYDPEYSLEVCINKFYI